MRKVEAFSLIELLVVVSIIAILAAMLFPVFAVCLEHSRQARCSSNLRQIYGALQLYVQDADETYPPGDYSTLMAGYLYPYLRQAGYGVWICPSDPDRSGRADSGGDVATMSVSYSPSDQFFNDQDANDAVDSMRLLSTVIQPDHSIMFYEGNTISWFPSYTTPPTSLELNPIGSWHNGRGNYLFADGHVRLLSLHQTLSPDCLWDNLRNWCPECDNAQYGYDASTISERIQELASD